MADKVVLPQPKQKTDAEKLKELLSAGPVTPNSNTPSVQIPPVSQTVSRETPAIDNAAISGVSKAIAAQPETQAPANNDFLSGLMSAPGSFWNYLNSSRGVDEEGKKMDSPLASILQFAGSPEGMKVASGLAAQQNDPYLAQGYLGEAASKQEQENFIKKMEEESKLRQQQAASEAAYRSASLNLQQQELAEKQKEALRQRAKDIGLKGKDIDAFVESGGGAKLRDPGLIERYAQGKQAVVTNNAENKVKQLPKNIDTATLNAEEVAALRSAGYAI